MMGLSGAELGAIYLADQRDREDVDVGRLTPGEMVERDRIRRCRVDELVAEGELATADDYFHAAMIFQHGGSLAYFWRAHELALRAAELGHEGEAWWCSARWLAAAAYDRWLMWQGKPQKYGTQYAVENGEKLLWEVDPDTTDEERAKWNVPCLADALQHAGGRIRQADPCAPPTR
jgi:hypothetical protein